MLAAATVAAIALLRRLTSGRTDRGRERRSGTDREADRGSTGTSRGRGGSGLGRKLRMLIAIGVSAVVARRLRRWIAGGSSGR